jgi:HD-GYP domain-containing protein (c-di-GMP phosphodiesterase class II)
VPNNFQDVYRSYLEYLSRTGHPVAEFDQVIREIEAEPAPATAGGGIGATATAEPKPKSEEALLVRDVIEDEELSQEEKARILSAVSQDLLRSLNQITTRGADAREEGFKRCKEIADEILSVAAQNSNIYDEIMALRNSQEEIEHSVIVGTIAVMFGLALGLSDEQLLSDMTVASIFHDIGLVRVKPEILAKAESKWSQSDRTDYETHVQSSLDILKESGAEFHPRVYRMIAEHHENYDGSGFPKALKGAQIDEPSQLLHLANLFDRLCTGKQTGQELSPAEAFDYIYDLAENPKAVQEVQPELVQRIFQFMLTEKDAAASLQKSAEKRVQEAVKETL